MTRLELLKKEREIVKGLRCMSFNDKDRTLATYDHEIKCIEEYGTYNPEIGIWSHDADVDKEGN